MGATRSFKRKAKSLPGAMVMTEAGKLLFAWLLLQGMPMPSLPNTPALQTVILIAALTLARGEDIKGNDQGPGYATLVWLKQHPDILEVIRQSVDQGAKED